MDEPKDNPKPTAGHGTAFQRDKIQLHQPEQRHKLLQPGKYHRTLIQPHPQGQTPQPRRMPGASKLILQGHSHPDIKTREGKHMQKIKLQANITDEHRCKNPQRNLSKQNSEHIKKLTHYDQVGFIPRM